MNKLCFIMACLATAISYHASAEVMKVKQLSGHFNVSASDAVTIDNQYGKVDVTTWDKNEVSVSVAITVTAGNAEKAEKLLNRITIDEPDKNGPINYTTKIGSGWNVGINVNTTQSMEINYTIQMPRRNPLNIVNKFGNVFVKEFEGKMNIQLQYGNLTTGELKDGNKYIKVAFGNAAIPTLEAAKIEMSYGNLDVDKAERLDVVNKFGKTNITNVQSLKIDQRYGDLKAGTVGQIIGSVEFSNVEFESLQRSADMKLKYCNKADLGNIGAGADMIKLVSNFSSISCHLSENSNLDIKVHTSFGKVRNNSKGLHLQEADDGESYSNDSDYSGRTGNGKGSMSVTAHYGDVRFR